MSTYSYFRLRPDLRPLEGLTELLTQVGIEYEDAQHRQRSAEVHLAELFAESQRREDITVSEAARRAGIERPVAYRLMAKVKGSGA